MPDEANDLDLVPSRALIAELSRRSVRIVVVQDVTRTTDADIHVNVGLGGPGDEQARKVGAIELLHYTLDKLEEG